MFSWKRAWVSEKADGAVRRIEKMSDKEAWLSDSGVRLQKGRRSWALLADSRYRCAVIGFGRTRGMKLGDVIGVFAQDDHIVEQNF